MEQLDKIIENLEMVEDGVKNKNNECLRMFDKIIDKDSVNKDTYYSARAFTSIINTITNKKVEYILYIIDNQKELISFLQTYDDKYLSSIPNLLMQKMTTEFLIVSDLMADVYELISFLVDFLTSIINIKKNDETSKLPNHLQQKLDNMLQDFNKKYRGGNEI